MKERREPHHTANGETITEMLSRPGSPSPSPRPDQDLKKVVLIGLETKTRSRDPHPWTIKKAILLLQYIAVV